MNDTIEFKRAEEIEEPIRQYIDRLNEERQREIEVNRNEHFIEIRVGNASIHRPWDPERTASEDEVDLLETAVEVFKLNQHEIIHLGLLMAGGPELAREWEQERILKSND